MTYEYEVKSGKKGETVMSGTVEAESVEEAVAAASEFGELVRLYDDTGEDVTPGSEEAEEAPANTALEELEARRDLEIMNMGVPGLKKGKVQGFDPGEEGVAGRLESREDPLYVRQCPVGNAFTTLSNVRTIVDGLKKAGVFSQQDMSLSDVVLAALTVIDSSKDKIYALVRDNVFEDERCKTPVESDTIDSLTLADFVLLLQSVWAINSQGALGKMLRRLTTSK